MPGFVHQRHKPPTQLDGPRGLILACPPLRSSVNLSRMVRLAGCSGIGTIIVTGTTKIDEKIARDGAKLVNLERRRTLLPALKKYREAGYALIGLEQTENSTSLHTFQFPHKTVLITGSEREGLSQGILDVLEAAVEIPVYGLPYSYNVATACTMAVYEYCKQFPAG